MVIMVNMITFTMITFKTTAGRNIFSTISDAISSRSRKRRGAAREWTTVKECSSKKDADVWMAEMEDIGHSMINPDSNNSSNKFTNQIDTSASGVTANSCMLFRDGIQFVCTSNEY
uniref:Uncharacterized protein n=1 Tax=Ditylenchus dipsaci TaxID=166011 RepID=A0A915DB88_9BILA